MTNIDRENESLVVAAYLQWLERDIETGRNVRAFPDDYRDKLREGFAKGLVGGEARLNEEIEGNVSL
ncbi:MAG TPA: hypothetical protein VIC53_05335 [Wenzhouxiangella sp.]